MSRNARKLWARHIAATEGELPVKKASPGGADVFSLGRPFSGRLLGIDPSLRGTGLAVIDVGEGMQLSVVATVTVKLNVKYSMIECLGRIAAEVTTLLDRHQPNHVAVEETIYVQNFRTAQILGAARGASIAPCAMRMLPIFEYAPLRVKQAVAGYGRASKEQVLASIRAQTGTDLGIAFDESDAVAVALCHAYTWREPLAAVQS